MPSLATGLELHYARIRDTLHEVSEQQQQQQHSALVTVQVSKRPPKSDRNFRPLSIWTRTIAAHSTSNARRNDFLKDVDMVEEVMQCEPLESEINNGAMSGVGGNASDDVEAGDNERDGAAESGIKVLENLMKYFERIAAMGWSLSPEQHDMLHSLIESIVPRVLGSSLIRWSSYVWKRWRIGDFNTRVAFRIPRRRGKSLVIALFISGIMACVPNCSGIMVNLGKSLATQNMGYVVDFLQTIQRDPVRAINFKYESNGLWLFVTPDGCLKPSAAYFTPGVNNSKGQIRTSPSPPYTYIPI